MTRLVLVGMLLGFTGTLGAAHWVPWVSYTRLPSRTSVVANGGRQERFVIRLPADRIASFGRDGSLRGGPYPQGSELLDASAENMPLLEHFKIRDDAGNVIGIAARHRLTFPAGAGSTWMLSIPSRGSLVVAAPGEAIGRIDIELKARGYVPGSPWKGDFVVAVSPNMAATRTVSSTGEFAGLTVQFTETWHLTGVTGDGDLRGTIELQTIGTRPQ